jgi:hypothetical protein
LKIGYYSAVPGQENDLRYQTVGASFKERKSKFQICLHLFQEISFYVIIVLKSTPTLHALKIMALQGLAWAIQNVVVYLDGPVMKPWHRDQGHYNGKG